MEKISNVSSENMKDIYRYNEECYERIDSICSEYSLMPQAERKFVNGMVSYFKPKRILEIGVALGGGSLVILNAIKNCDSTLVSVDIENKYVNDANYEVGFIALNSPYVNLQQWELHTGVDVSKVLQKQDRAGKTKFDFVVIDTAHIHPVESLNFLSILPFLAEDAIILVQDISLYAMCLHLHGYWHIPLSEGAKIRNASKLLYDTVVGDKFKLPIEAYSEEDKKRWNIEFSNMGVVQITKDTWKYISNVFSMLEYPWGLYPRYLKNISQIIKEYYSEEQYKSYIYAMNKNLRLLYHKTYTYRLSDKEMDFCDYKKIIFYGAGKQLENYFAQKNLILFPDEIWDTRAEVINSLSLEYLEGFKVLEPVLSGGDENTLIVLMIDNINNRNVADDMMDKCKSAGYKCIIYVDDLYHMFM